VQENQPFIDNQTSASLPSETCDRTNHASFLFLWWLKILFLSLAVAACAAIAVTLSKFNTQEQQAWEYSINLNTLVAILSTLLRASMVVVVEEGMTPFFLA
jgi:hypothetical protein